MGLTRRKPRTWTCPKCKRKNEARTSSRTCAYGCGATKPARKLNPKRVPVDSYDVYELLSVTIHGGDQGACGVCRKMPGENRKHDRDHDHTTGKPRGLACGGDYGCNVLMQRWVTPATARGIADAKRAAGEPDAERWEAIAAYLERVEAHYRDR